MSTRLRKRKNCRPWPRQSGKPRGSDLPLKFFWAPWGVMKFAYLKDFNSYMVKPCSNPSKPSLFFSRNLQNDGTSKRMMGGWGYWFVIRERETMYPTNVEQPLRCSSWARTRWATRWRPYRLQPWSTPVSRGRKSQDGMLESDGNEKIAGFVFDTFYDEMWRYHIYCKLMRYIQI